MESGAVFVGTSKPGQQAKLATAAAGAKAAAESLWQREAKGVTSLNDAAAPDVEPTSAPAPAPTTAAARRNDAQPPDGQPTMAEQPDARLAAAAAAMGWGARAARPGRCPPLGPEVAAAVATNSTIIFTCAARRLPLPVARGASPPPAPIPRAGGCQPAVGECSVNSPSLCHPPCSAHVGHQCVTKAHDSGVPTIAIHVHCLASRSSAHFP